MVVTHDPEFIRTCCTDFAPHGRRIVCRPGALDNVGWSKVLSFFENTLQRNKEDWNTMDIANYADGGNVRRVTLIQIILYGGRY